MGKLNWKNRPKSILLRVLVKTSVIIFTAGIPNCLLSRNDFEIAICIELLKEIASTRGLIVRFCSFNIASIPGKIAAAFTLGVSWMGSETISLAVPYLITNLLSVTSSWSDSASIGGSSLALSFFSSTMNKCLLESIRFNCYTAINNLNPTYQHR